MHRTSTNYTIYMYYSTVCVRMSVNKAGTLLRNVLHKQHIIKLATIDSAVTNTPTTRTCLNFKQLLYSNNTDKSKTRSFVLHETIKDNMSANNTPDYTLPVIHSSDLTAYKQSLQNANIQAIEPLRYRNNTNHQRRFTDDELNAEVDRVKRKHRTALKSQQSWQRYSYIDQFERYNLQTFASMPKLHAVPQSNNKYVLSHSVQRVHTDELTVEQFVTQYEQCSEPLIISGCADHWPATHKWTWQYFGSDELQDIKFKCGEDDEGYSVKMRLKHFVEYAQCNRDDSPLYVFDQSAMEHDLTAAKLLNEYTVPKYFQPDLFDVVADDRRPPHRWVLLGPERSGSSLHIDPLNTSAWNTLISGRKQWVLFKSSAKKSIVKGEHLKLRNEDNEAITYFMNILPRIKAEEQCRIDRGEEPILGIREFIQYPGDTVYIPGGWHHAVLNLEDSIAVTQNFCSKTNFPAVWRKTRVARKHMARRWQATLLQTYVDMGELSVQINEQDNFDANFYIDDEKHRQKKVAKKHQKKSREQHSDNNAVTNTSSKKSKTIDKSIATTSSGDDSQ